MHSSMSNARSLASLPLAELRSLSTLDCHRIELADAQTAELLTAMLDASDSAVAGLATRAARHADGPAEALYHLLTRNRFIKGSRSLFPRETAVGSIRRFTDAGAPVHVVIRGFPYKQRDNGLKAVGPLPDLAEAAALVRLRELRTAFARSYPPGVRITVMADGGYYRPRAEADLHEYRAELLDVAKLIQADEFVQFEDQAAIVARAIGPQRWRMRGPMVVDAVDEITAVCRPARRSYRSDLAAGELARAGLEVPPTEGPSFHDLFRSMVYSVPVAGRDTDPAWAAQVLADVHRLDGVPPALRQARRGVLDQAWDDSIGYLAIALTDYRMGVRDALPPHIRLATGAPRAGAFGFAYLGGSTVLPWHGTGCVDGSGRVGVDFAVALHDRGFVPVYSSRLAHRQPWLMVPRSATEVRCGRVVLCRELAGRVQLKAR